MAKACKVCGRPTDRNRLHCPACIANKAHVKKPKAFEDLRRDGSRRQFLLNNCPHRCELCLIEEWRGEPVPLVMDHIDGNPENNARDNLRLICPNCDAQLPTFKARNRGNGRAFRRERYKQGKSF